MNNNTHPSLVLSRICVYESTFGDLSRNETLAFLVPATPHCTKGAIAKLVFDTVAIIVNIAGANWMIATQSVGAITLLCAHFCVL